MIDKEISLDPKSEEEWDKFRQSSHEIIDDMIDYIKNINEQKVWKSIPDNIKTKFTSSVPQQSAELKSVFKDFKENILPYPAGNIHPRFWGYVQGTGSPAGMIADFLISTMNSNTGGRDQAAIYVERQVINWSKEILNFDQNASGILTTGCSESNLIGLIIARNSKVAQNINEEGLIGRDQKAIFYTSDQVHSSVKKALEIIGIGTNSLRIISSDENYKINIGELVKTIEDDINHGNKPVCIIANVGTVNTGAIDPLDKISELCKKYDLWMHIDGAFGILVNFVPEYQKKIEMLRNADSIAFDFHKWMYMPYDVGCVLIKDEILHRKSFSHRPDYLAQTQRGLGGGGRWASDYGIQLSRSFRALKVWFLINVFGIDTYRKLIEKNIAQARYFGNLVKDEPKLELLAPIEMNIVCFRFNPGNTEEDELNKINQELLFRLQEDGNVVPSSTKLHNKFSLRVAIVNQRSSFKDFDILKNEVIQLGSKIITEKLI